MRTEQQRFFVPFRLDLLNEQLWRDGEEIILRRKTFEVLRYLVDHPRQLVTKTALLDSVWPAVAVSDSMPAICVGELRKALGDEAKAPRFIETAHGRGYRFIAHVTEVAAAVPATRPQPLAVTPLMVGREEELAQIGGFWAKATAGTRQVIFVSGEAGIGKTTFVTAFLARAERGAAARIGRGQCVEPYGVGEPYMPVLEALTRLCQEPESAQLLDILRRFAPTWFARMPSLRSEAERERTPGGTEDVDQQRMLREMAQALEKLSAETPLVLLLEDLHWSDFSTLELIAAVARRTEPASLLILATFRPVEMLAVDHPLRALKQELELHQQCEELRLNLLNETEVATYLGLRFAEDASKYRGLAPAIYQRTEGNPLFMVNVVDDLVAQGPALGTSKIEAPRNIRQMIERNLGRLTADEQTVLESASVAGAEFSAAAVAAALERAVGEVEVCCARLSRHEQFLRSEGASEWPDGSRATRYRFLHALYQGVLYERTPVGQRDALHRRIAARQEAAWGERSGEVATELAYHYERCGNKPKALKYLELAAKQAEFRLAHHDAMRHYFAALCLLKSSPESIERDRRELELWHGYLPVVLRTRELSTGDAGAGFERALELCERLGETAQKFRLLRRLSEFHSGRAEHRVAYGLAMRMLDIAKSRGLQSWHQSAYTQLGSTLYHLGDLRAAHGYLDQALRYVEDPGSSVPNPQSARIECLSVDAEALWMLGYADQARKRTQESVALARNSATPSTLALALTRAHMLSFFGGEYERALEYAQEGLKLCAQWKFEHLEAALAWSRHNVRIFMGLDNDLEKLRRAFANYHQFGTKLHLAANCMFLARCYSILGRPDLGIATIDQSIAATEETEQRTWEAESWRIKGELTVQDARQRKSSGERLRAAQNRAEQHIRKAIDLARGQAAKLFELRATVSLARLLADSQQRRQARAMLTEVCGWFTEGLDALDLKAAQLMLDELSSPASSAAVIVDAR